MSEQEFIDTPEDLEFAKGFNDGWIIAEYRPKISKIIGGALQRTEGHGNMYLVGVQEGVLSYAFEKTKDRYKNYQSPDRDGNHNKDKGRNKE